MAAVYRIYERTGHGARVVAEVRDGEVTGESSASIRNLLEAYGFPDVPIEEVIDRFLLASLRRAPAWGRRLFSRWTSAEFLAQGITLTI